MFLAVSTHQEGRNVGHLTAHSNVALANQTRAWWMDFDKPQLEDSGLQASLCNLCCSASQHVIELCLRLSQEVQPMHASQHCITLRDRLVASVSQLRMETFLDRCRLAVGLTVPWVLCLGHKLGVITQSHDLLHSISAALTSDGIFVCSLLIRSVIEPSIPASNSPTATA